MTGAEMFPVAKVVASTAKKAVDDSADAGTLQKLAEDSPAMKAAAESYARRVAVKQAVLLRVYQPIARFLGLSREYFDTQFHADLAGKVADIPEEHLATPSPSVAIPAMQGLGYSIDEADLKEMYLSLLATATDARVAKDAHPSFAEIIKQLSPEEASPLLDVLQAGELPIGRVFQRAQEGTGERTALKYLLPYVEDDLVTPQEVDGLAVWLDNWVRLGLIDVDVTRSYVEAERYTWIHERPELLVTAEGDPRGVEGFRIQHGILETTSFGRRFYSAVSYNGVSLKDAPGVKVDDTSRGGESG